jgi:hypothetical protein
MPMDDVKIPKWLWGIVVAAIIAWMGWVSVQIQTQSNTAIETKTILSNLVATNAQDQFTVRDLQTTVAELKVKIQYLEQKVAGKE